MGAGCGRKCPLCACDVAGSGSITATDALNLLRRAVGQIINLQCPSCGVAVGTITFNTSIFGRTIDDLQVRANGPVLRQGGAVDGVPTTMGGMPSATYEIEILNVPDDCVVDEQNPRDIEVIDGGSLNEAFTVLCGDPTCAVSGKIAFSARRDTSQNVLHDIYVLDLEDPPNSEIQLMSTPNLEAWPAIKSDSSEIAYSFTTQPPGTPGVPDCEILFISPSGLVSALTLPRPPRLSAPRADNTFRTQLDWSNNGLMLAIASNEGAGAQDNNFDIYVNGGRLTSDIGGAYIVFEALSNQTRSWDPFIMQPNGTCVRQITFTDLLDEIQASWGN